MAGTAFCDKFEDFIQWLTAENEFSDSVIESLKGQCMYCLMYMYYFYCLCNVENEIDHESFMLLTDSDIFDIVKPIGTRRKLIAKRDELKNSKRISRKENSELANEWQKNNTEKEPTPSDNDCYHTDIDDGPGSEIIWEDDFALSQYQDIDKSYEVAIYYVH